MAMEVAETKEGAWTILTITGQIDNYTSADFENIILPLINNGARNLILDYAGVMFVSSAGLRVLILAAKQQNAHKGIIVFCNLKPTLVRFFEASGLGTVFKIVPALKDALALPVSA